MELGARYDNDLQRAIDAERSDGRLQQYSENDSELTADAKGLHAKGIPRFAWWMIGAGIALFLACAGIAIVRLAN